MIRLATIVVVCAAALVPAGDLAIGQDHSSHHAAQAESRPVPLFEGLGPVHHPVTTKSPQAQQYFDQGLAFIYAFNHDEAARSFREAARLDPDMAMAYWGVALALGPNINMPQDENAGREAYGALQKGLVLKPKISQKERDYIDALATRYAPDGKPSPELDQAYAEAMRKLRKKYPDDLDAATLAAEAIMDTMPWQYWSVDGKPAPGTGEVIEVLEMVLEKNPRHTGANHYYIHAVEASPHPERALKSADRLGALAPAAGHLVHMPSHIYIRTGRYRAGAESNEAAIEADRKYIASQKPNPAAVYPLMYATHNVHFLWACRMAEGNQRAALAAARELDGSIPPDAIRQMPMAEFMVPVLLFANARFAMWDEILAAKTPPADFKYSTGIWHYSRGLALLAKGRTADARQELRQLNALAEATAADHVVGLNSAKTLLELASLVLAGQIASEDGHKQEAVRDLRRAVEIQDRLQYEEPPAWYYPVRQTLGAELLRQGRAAEAEVVFREDLKRNPENGWSLYGLAEALRARGADDEAAAVDARFKKAWADPEVTPRLSAVARAATPSG